MSWCFYFDITSDDGMLPAWHQAIIWGPIISIFIHIIYLSYSYDIYNIILIYVFKTQWVDHMNHHSYLNILSIHIYSQSKIKQI